jgi:CRP-like cAMP-binding protein
MQFVYNTREAALCFCCFDKGLIHMPIPAAVADELVNTPIFKGLTAAEAADFFASAAQVTQERGAVLFREGDHGDALLVVLDGEVGVFKGGVELARLKQHSVLGELALVDEAESRTATAIAMTDVQLIQLPADPVRAQLRAGNLAALKVVSNLAMVVSKRLSAINQKLVLTMAEKNHEELASFNKILTRWDF